MSAVTTPPLVGQWRLDTIHSSIAFAVRRMEIATFRGRLANATADFIVGNGNTRLRGSVAVADIELPATDLRRHLLSPEFFDADRHPAIAFESQRVTLADGTISLAGTVTIRGVTRPIDATGHLDGPSPDPLGDERIGMALEATLDRRDFGLDWQARL